VAHMQEYHYISSKKTLYIVNKSKGTLIVFTSRHQ
jgi:hypothetical protein